MVNIGGAVTAASGTGVDVYTFTKDASIDNAVISKFKVGTDHLHLVGYGAGQSGVASIGKTSAGYQHYPYRRQPRQSSGSSEHQHWAAIQLNRVFQEQGSGQTRSLL